MGHFVASDLTMAEAKRSRINAFGIEYGARTATRSAQLTWRSYGSRSGNARAGRLPPAAVTNE